jgi:Rieske Fe-S protein
MGHGRRNFVKVVTLAGGALVAALVAVPGVAYLLDPILRRKGGGQPYRPLVDLSLLREGHPVAVDVIGDKVDAWTRARDVRLGTVWLCRGPGGTVSALSAECPHLGCKIGFRKDTNQFACPCHESAFSLEGAVLGGPSPRAMDALPVRVRSGKVEVLFQRFRTQTAARQAIG